jgi:hypothetical protein
MKWYEELELLISGLFLLIISLCFTIGASYLVLLIIRLIFD